MDSSRTCRSYLGSGVGFMAYVLVACEESQAVAMAFRRLGVLAFPVILSPVPAVILSGISSEMQECFSVILASL